MVIYQYDNSIHIYFIVLFSLLLLIGIVLGGANLPLLKLIIQKGNPIKAKIILIFIIVIIFAISLSLVTLSIKNISHYYADVKGTNADCCSVVTGKIEHLQKIPQYARGANLTSYHLMIEIDDSYYYIDADVGVVAENIELWDEIESITIYYINIDGKNVVLRALKN